VKGFKRIFYALIGVGSIVLTFGLSGFVVAATHHLRYWAYPTFFGVGILLAGSVLILMKPASRPRGSFWERPWVRRFLTVDEERLSRGIWPWVRRRGPFALVLAAAMIFGPFFAALVVRFLGLPERRAWLYVFLTTLVAVGFWVSVYLGLLEAVVSKFGSVFSL